MLRLETIGAVIEHSVSEKRNDGEMEFTELSRDEAKSLFNKCVLYKEENQ